MNNFEVTYNTEVVESGYPHFEEEFVADKILAELKDLHEHVKKFNEINDRYLTILERRLTRKEEQE